MSPVMMAEHRTRMVACWKTGFTGLHERHAVYVQYWEKDEKKGNYNFQCINSWGTLNKPYPQLTEADLSEIYYISLTKSANNDTQ